MMFGMSGWGIDLNEVEKMVNYYLEKGGNFIDIVNFYVVGKVEIMFG